MSIETIAASSDVMTGLMAGSPDEAEVDRRLRHQTVLYQFTDRLYRANSDDEIYSAALHAIISGLGCDRASILLFDTTGVMRFVAWHGLSDAYRKAVDGHSPWRPGDTDPTPIFLEDILDADEPDELKAVISGEGISALGFIPLMAEGTVIGKFMTYHDESHRFTHDEMALAINIARQLGFAVARQRGEAAKQLLLAELSHRVKNTLATVISIAHQSFGRDPALVDVRKRFESRLRALAQTHTRLAESDWSSVDLETMLRDELAPHGVNDGGSISISGPPIALLPRQAIMLGMGFHELATNAAKYGALHAASGRVGIDWRVRPDGRTLEIVWSETGGPPVTMPDRNGFGRLLLERAMATELQGRVAMDFAPKGLACSITFPLRPDRS